MTPTIRLYCARPKCHEPAEWQIPFANEDQILYTCQKCFDIFIRSFPSSKVKVSRVYAGNYLPLGYDPIKQTKKEGGQFTVKRTIGGQKP